MAVVPEHDMKFKVVMMTPEWAEELLTHNHSYNRNPKDKRIASYAREMASGLWRLTHQAIAIDEDGNLVDGQNRLHAVIRAGVEVPMVVVTGVPRKAMVGVDCGVTRNVADAAKVSGKPLPAVQYANVARIMMVGLQYGYKQALGNQEILHFIGNHKEALNFSFECLRSNTPGIAAAGVRAVIARAWYQRNCRTRIREFCKALLNGLIDDKVKDVSVIRLRNWLLQAKGTRQPVKRTDVYAKTERALKAFLDGEELDTIYASKEELFPIPLDGLLEEVGEEDGGPETLKMAN